MPKKKKPIKKPSTRKKIASTTKTSSKKKKVVTSIGMKRGDGLKRWHAVRREVKINFDENNKTYSVQELNQYSSKIYRDIKDDYVSASDNLDIIVSDYFSEDFRKGEPLPTFSWWLLSQELDKLPIDSLIVVDNNDAIKDEVFSGSILDYKSRISGVFINHMNARYKRSSEYMFMYIHYTKGNTHYFLLLKEESPLLNMDSDGFEKWMKNEGISLSNIAGYKEYIEPEIDLSMPDYSKKGGDDTLAIENAKNKGLELKLKVLEAAEKLGLKGDALNKFLGL